MAPGCADICISACLNNLDSVTQHACVTMFSHPCCPDGVVGRLLLVVATSWRQYISYNYILNQMKTSCAWIKYLSGNYGCASFLPRHEIAISNPKTPIYNYLIRKIFESFWPKNTILFTTILTKIQPVGTGWDTNGKL